MKRIMQNNLKMLKDIFKSNKARSIDITKNSVNYYIDKCVKLEVLEYKDLTLERRTLENNTVKYIVDNGYGQHYNAGQELFAGEVEALLNGKLI